MHILTRRVGEKFRIGDCIVVEILEINHSGNVRLGVLVEDVVVRPEAVRRIAGERDQPFDDSDL